MSKKRYIIIAKCFDRKGNQLSFGTNNYRKTHPMMQHFAKIAGLPEKEYLHAEIQALLRVKDKQVYRLTVERYDSEGNPALAKPCAVCQEAIKAFGVSVVEYTDSTGFNTIKF
jgi:glucuronate isomerase